MAVDPQISLNAGKGVTQFDPFGSAKGALSLVDLMQKVDMQPALLKQKLEGEQVITTGNRIANEQAQRALNAKKKAASYFKKHTKVDNKGMIYQDKDRLMRDITEDPDIDIESGLDVITKLATTEAQKIKTDSDAVKLANDYAANTVNLMRKVPDGKPEQAAALADALAAQLQKMPGMTPELMQQTLKTHLGPRPDDKIGPDGKPLPRDSLEDGNAILSWAKGIVAPTRITPQEEEANQRDQQRINLEVKKATEEYLKMTSKIPPANVRADSLTKSAELDSVVGGINDGVEASKNLTRLGTKPGEIVAKVWNDIIVQDPNAGRLQAQIDSYNIRHPNAKMSITDGLDAVTAKLNQEARTLSGVSQNLRAIATSGNVGEAAQAGPTPPVAAPAPPPSKQVSPLPGLLKAGDSRIIDGKSWIAKSKAEASKLKSGTPFLATDGKIRTAP